jgi:glycosyltransferase involved in cell wall biosynthesis
MLSSELPFVSVVIPTRNMRDLLRDTVESLYKQSYPGDRYEIIVVDNSSIDGTEEMMQTMQQSSPCALRYYCKADEGPGASRNMGIAQAKGPIIAFTDADCVAEQDWLKNGTAKMVEGTGLVQGRTIPNPAHTNTTFSRTMSVAKENGLYPTCNIFYRKNVLDQLGGFSPDFCGINCLGSPRWGGEDTDLAWRVKKQGWKSVFADDTVIYHHIFPLRPWQVITAGLRKYQLQGLFYAMPYLVKKHPELRNYLYHRYFLSRTKALFDIFFLSFVTGILLHKIFFLLALPYLVVRSKDAFHFRPLKEYHRGLLVLIISILVDLEDFILLLSGSIWNRSIIL